MPTLIGAKLRAARTSQGMPLSQLAATSGMSRASFSRVERDETEPSVSTLVQLCQVLSLAVGVLFTEPEIPHVAFADAPRINLGGVHAAERLLSPRSEERMQLLRLELEPHAQGGSELYAIDCDVEVLHVILGEVTVRFADRSVAQRAGVAQTFPGREPQWEVTGRASASMAWVIVPAPGAGRPDPALLTLSRPGLLSHLGR